MDVPDFKLLILRDIPNILRLKTSRLYTKKMT